jgi:hypothetical protein
MPYDINSQQSFEVIPLKPNDQGKTWVCTIETLLNPNYRHDAPSGARQWSLPEHDASARSITPGI